MEDADDGLRDGYFFIGADNPHGDSSGVRGNERCALSISRRLDFNAQKLEAGAGFHRFVWDLHEARPPAIRYGYGIGAVWGEGTPIQPGGAWVLPGKYTVALAVNGKTYNAPLSVTEDPRIKVSLADLKASSELSQQIAAISAEARIGYGEQRAVAKQLDGIKDKSLHAFVDRVRDKPAPGAPTFENVDSILTSIEGDLESVDDAPTAAEHQAFDDAKSKLADLQRRWNATKSGPLVALNAALEKSGKKPVTVPPPNALDFSTTDEGQDLP